MSYMYVRYKCGHQGRESIYGSRATRDKLLAGIEEKMYCPECRARREDEAAAAQKLLAIKVEALELPSLAGGTLAQRNWADEIRLRAVMAFLEYIHGAQNEDEQLKVACAKLQSIRSEKVTSRIIQNRAGYPRDVDEVLGHLIRNQEGQGA